MSYSCDNLSVRAVTVLPAVVGTNQQAGAALMKDAVMSLGSESCKCRKQQLCDRSRFRACDRSVSLIPHHFDRGRALPRFMRDRELIVKIYSARAVQTRGDYVLLYRQKSCN